MTTPEEIYEYCEQMIDDQLTKENLMYQMPPDENLTYKDVADWIGKTRRECKKYYDVGLWHPIYGEMNTIWDVIRVIEEKHKEELK